MNSAPRSARHDPDRPDRFVLAGTPAPSRDLDRTLSELYTSAAGVPKTRDVGLLAVRAVEGARSGLPAPKPTGNTPLHHLVARLLAAAAGDEKARLELPPELLPLVTGEAPDSIGQSDQR